MADLKKAYVALGANLASGGLTPRETLAAATAEMGRVESITAVSRFFRTPCFPPGAGPDYVNAAVAISTGRTPSDLLAWLHGIEARFWRERTERWGQRTLDLDLLAVGDLICPDIQRFKAWVDLPADEQRLRAPDGLILPHPRMHERAFVLVPLAEIAPGWRHPVLGRTVAEMAADLSDEAKAEIVPL